MSLISVRLPDELLQQTKLRSQALHMSPANYIRKAIMQMNEEILIQQQKQQLIKASLKVREESMAVNAEFSQVEHDPEA